MMNFKFIFRVILYALGAAFILFALAAANDAYASFLLGANAKDLSFGPALFRVLLFFHGAVLIAVAAFYEKLSASSFEQNFNKDEPKTSLQTWLALGVLTLTALGLRLWNLNTDLWTDEVFTLIDFARQPFGVIVTSFPSQNQHLLYSLLARFSLDVFGESAWSLRLPAVVFGAACVPAIFILARRIAGTTEAWLAAALMTVSYHHVWFSQNARGYTGLLFFTLIATNLWFAALEKNSWRAWFLYAAAIVGGLWIHLTMLFVIAAHGLCFLAFWIFPKLSGDRFKLESRALFKVFAAWLLGATVTLQLYALALPEFLSVGLHEESNASEWTNPLWVLTETISNLSIGFAGIAVVIFGAAFVFCGWLALLAKNRRAAILMVLPPLLAGAFILSAEHNLFPRFFFFAMGFGLIIVVRGAVEVPKILLSFGAVEKLFKARPNFTNRLGYALAGLLIAASLLTVPRNYALPKQDFSGAKNYVESNARSGEKIVAVRIAGEIYSRYFAPQWSAAKTEADLSQIEQTPGKTWLVYTLAPEIKAFRPQLWQTIEKDFEIVRVFPGTLAGGEIVVCRRKSEEVKNESNRNDNQTENHLARR